MMKSMDNSINAKILIVEDELVQAEMLRRMLITEGFAVIIAANGKEALGLIPNINPSLIISDIVMPEMDGYEFCRLIKLDDSIQHIPVILLTELKEPSDIIKGLESNADSFISKPYDKEHLILKINNLLANLPVNADKYKPVPHTVTFGNKTHIVNSTYQQLFELLFDTYENIIIQNKELLNRSKDLRESEELYRNLFNSSSDAIFLVDLDTGLIVNANHQAEILLKKHHEEIIGLKSSEIHIPTKKEYSKIGNNIIENTIKYSDGSSAYVEIVLQMVNIKDRPLLQAMFRDITERKIAIEALKKSEEKFRGLIERNFDVISLLDTQGFFIYSSPSVYKISGLLPEEIIGKHLNDFIAEQDLPKISSSFKELLNGNTIKGLEVKVKRKNGAIGIIEVNAFPIIIDNKITEIQLIHRDITERKEKEEIQGLIFEYYKCLFEDSNSIMLLVDPETSFIFDANKKACDYYGYSKEEITSMKITDINTLPAEEVSRIIESVSVQKADHFIFRHRLNNGTIRDVEVYSSPVKIKEKHLLFSIIHDIYDRMILEDERNRFFNKSLHMICIASNDGYFKLVNPMFTKVLGFTAEEIYSRPMAEFMHPDDVARTFEEVEKQIKGLITTNFENRYLCKDGSYKILSWMAGPVLEGGRIYAVARDVTLQKKLEEEIKTINLNLQHKVTEEVNKNRIKDQIMFEQAHYISLGELLMNISHHWRQPLCSVGLFIQDIKDAYLHNELNETYLDNSVKHAMNELKMLSNTIDNFRNFYIRDKKYLEFNISAEINKAEMILFGEIQEKGILIEKQLDDYLIIKGDPHEFAHVILNILTNAIENFEKINIPNRVIKIKLYKEDIIDKIIIIISDNGGGISKEIINKVFDPYFTTKDKIRGTGMGLYMVKMIIEKNLNGSISLINSDNGCEFRIEL